MGVKILIIEDEDAAVRRLQNMIVDVWPDAEILAALDSIRQSVAWLTTQPLPDLIFCDIQLADGSSFEIFKQVMPDCPVIFSTAYDQYALQAFEVNSIDYLLKPVRKEELQRALDRYLKMRPAPAQTIGLDKLLQVLQSNKVNYKDRFVVKYGEHIKTIDAAEIAYLYTENKVNFLVTKDARRFAIDYNLDQLEGVLDPKNFFRINRQFIISFQSISEMLTYTKSRVLVKLNPPTKLETIVSTERSPAFKSWLDGN